MGKIKSLDGNDLILPGIHTAAGMLAGSKKPGIPGERFAV
jgi:hypothetical protein